ncbi:MAG: M48 family metallopeptidase [Phycisphaerae bacterium]|nr:M48 family metallopeptidase [Phycisphaerae bacterium]
MGFSPCGWFGRDRTRAAWAEAHPTDSGGRFTTSTANEIAADPKRASNRAKRYSKSKLTVGVVKLALGFVFLLAFLLSGASEKLYGLFHGVTDNYHLDLSGYLLVFSTVYYLLFLPLDFYSDVTLERRYGLSNQTTAGWLARSAKEWGLSTLLVVGVLNLLYAVIRNLPDWWWLVAAIGWFVLLVLISKITPAVIVPLFYKTVPLKDHELADRLLALAGRCGVRVKRVFEIKLSRETNKANAAVVGLGHQRRILIGDTLLTLCSDDEIEAVFAHELGHVALHHPWKLLAGGAASFVLGFYLLYLVLGPSSVALGFQGPADIATVPLLMLWIAGFGFLSKPLQTAYSRRLEKQADLFTLDKVEKPETLASALTKLADRNLADPTPSRIVETLFYTHPPIAKRIAYIVNAAPQQR